MNKYRVEWDPPTPGKSDGYVRWYLNDKFLYGIKGESLNITGTSIPSEPMYLIMNTAVASSWGFPMPCPEGCDCKCFECGNPDCGCSLPVGYCDNFPANFEIDYVRVWQAKNEPKHQLGCSTEDRPTHLFIKGHKERYTEEGQKEPLQPVQIGGAACTSDLECGGTEHGSCNNDGFCVCAQGFAGSSCLSHFGFDDNPYSQIDNTLKGVLKCIIVAASYSMILVSHSVSLSVNFTVSLLHLSNHFLFTFSMFLFGFCVFFAMSVFQRRQEFRDAEEMQNFANSPIYHARRPYNSLDRKEQSDQQKPVSYCLIDGRLVDD